MTSCRSSGYDQIGVEMKYNPRGRVSSVNVQAEIYRQCVDSGLECVCEYGIPSTVEESGHDRMSVDVAVLSGDQSEVVCVAEAKNYNNLDRARNWDTMQARNYAALPVPAFLVCRRDHVGAFVRHAKGLSGWTREERQNHTYAGYVVAIHGPGVESYDVLDF